MAAAAQSIPWDAARQRKACVTGAILNIKHRRERGFDSEQLA
jgi:hypothetical protein